MEMISLSEIWNQRQQTLAADRDVSPLGRRWAALRTGFSPSIFLDKHVAGSATPAMLRKELSSAL